MWQALLQHAIDCAIAWDMPAGDGPVKRRLADLSGKVLQITCPEWRFSCFLCPHEQGMKISSHYNGTVDTCISGSAFQFFNIIRGRGTTQAIFDAGGISLIGDMQLVESMRSIWQALEIDWEEPAAKIFGNTCAHPIVNLIKRILVGVKKSSSSCVEQFIEYVHHESQQLPTPMMVETFISEVGQLRDAVDRLAARLKYLIS